MNSTVLKLISLNKTFRVPGQSSLTIFSNVNLELQKGELIGLVSPSGAGKTTLLQIAGLLDKPSSGEVFINGLGSNKMGDKKVTEIRRTEIGFVYQSHRLLPEFSAVENISIPQWSNGVSKTHAEERSIQLLKQVGLDSRKNHRPAELSGGEQQRVAICRALANKPSLLLADEPTGNLDTNTSELVFEILISLVRSSGLSALVATHNLSLAKRMDRLYELSKHSLMPIS